jgi:hypothetical protein
MVTVCKLDYATEHVLISWPGTVVALDALGCTVRAPFLPFGTTAVFVDGVPFEAGDVFTECYYWGRWFNVFHVAAADGTTRGWYCNVTQPAKLVDDTLLYVDMALDLFVHPDGRMTVLDEDEFELMERDVYRPEDAKGAREGLAQLLELATAGSLPRPVDEST